jgi:putative GTP pyrophosphokinase
MNDLDNWLDDVLPRHAALTDAVVSLIEKLLVDASIEYLSVSGRTKDRDGIKEKIRRKNYWQPRTQLTDISGIRVITFFESAVDEIADLIREAFDVDVKDSLDKSALLGIDRLGYRSMHFVCTLGPSRIALPEYRKFADLRFEIQVRTVLQHAWAELAHDRNYKFAGVLPLQIQRKLHLYAGMLEIADSGFDDMATEIDDYVEDLRQRAAVGDLNVEINSLSLALFLPNKTNELGIEMGPTPTASDLAGVIPELRAFGIKKVADLAPLFTSDFAAALKKHSGCSTPVGLLRELMMFADIDRYFADAWNSSWGGWDQQSLSVILEKYPDGKINRLIDEHEIDVVHFEDT